MTLIGLLNFDYLAIKEIDIIKSCLKWVQNDIIKKKLVSTPDNYLNAFKSIKNFILFTELSIKDLKDFKEISNVLSLEEIGQLYLYLNSSNTLKPLPFESKTSRKQIRSIILSNCNNNQSVGYSQFSIAIKVNHEIIITSIDLITSVSNLSLKIYKNDVNLNLKFDNLIGDDGINYINFNSKFILKPDIDYKLDFQFTSLNFGCLCNFSQLKYTDNNDKEIVFKFSNLGASYHFMKKVNFLMI